MGIYWLTSTGLMDSNSHWAISFLLFIALSLSLFCSLFVRQTLLSQQTETWPYMILTTLRLERIGPLLPQLELENSRERIYCPLLGCMPTLQTNSCSMVMKYYGIPSLGQVPNPLASTTQTNRTGIDIAGEETVRRAYGLH